MANAHRRLCRHFHAPAGHHDRQRRAAGHPEGAPHVLHRPAVGRRRLRADARDLHAERRLARRPAGPEAGLHRGRHPVHVRVSRVRRRPVAARPEPRPRRAGHRRGDHVRGLARDPVAGVPRARARNGVRDLGRDDRRGGGDRAARRRRAHHVGRLALDLLRQPPDRASSRSRRASSRSCSGSSAATTGAGRAGA
jgi:hypothetical protein